MQVEDSIDALSKRFLTQEQKEAIVKKLKERWGKVSQWTKENLGKAKEFLQGLDSDDFKELDKDKIKVLNIILYKELFV